MNVSVRMIFLSVFLRVSAANLKKQMFEELLDSIREGGAILRGSKRPSRRTAIVSDAEMLKKTRRKLIKLCVFLRVFAPPRQVCSNLQPSPNLLAVTFIY